MLFNTGTYKHESGFTIMVLDTGEVMFSTGHPVSLRLSEIFDQSKWTKVA